MPAKRGRRRPLFRLFGACLLAVALAALARRWLDVVEVRGGSMLPALHPGDRLLVERWTYSRRAPRAGEIVLAPDPRQPSRELIKRIVAVGDGVVELRGDAPAASTDSRTFGRLPVNGIRWRVTARYWPPRGAVRRQRRTRRPPRRMRGPQPAAW
jgi:nickel-type superoxide dismutase maturation protease